MLEDWKTYIDETFPDDSRLRVVVFREFFYQLIAFIISIGSGGGSSQAVLYVAQNLNTQQRATARTNIGALSSRPNGINPLITNLGIIDIIYLPESQYGPVPNYADQLNNQTNF